MIYQKREILNKYLDDEYFFNEYSTGIYLYKYEYDPDTDEYFKSRMYDKIREELVKNKYFILENIVNDGMFLQRITFTQSDKSYNRTGCVIGDEDKIGLNTTYSNGVYKFSEWKLDNVNENDPEVKRVLKSSSKDSVDERLVSRYSNDYGNIFKYKNRITIDQLKTTLETGFYSLVDEVSNFKKIISVKDEFYKRRASSRTDIKDGKVYRLKNEDKLQGVLEVYKFKNYIFQNLYISNPSISNLNRTFYTKTNQWTEWRINQTVDDTYWLQNVNPISTYTELPIIGRNLSINNNSILYKIRGYTDKSVLQNSLINYAYNKTDSFREVYNEFYKVEGKNPVDFIYGYKNVLTPDMVEKGPDYSKLYNESDFNNGIPRNNVNWGTSYISIDFNNDFNQSYIRQASTLGTGKLSTFGKSIDLDLINNKPVRESFRFINGLSIYWTSDKLYFDILQNIVVDTNVTLNTFN